MIAVSTPLFAPAFITVPGRLLRTRNASAAPCGPTAPDDSTSKLRSGSRPSLHAGRPSLGSSAAIPSRHSQSPVPTKRVPSRQQGKAAEAAESVRLLTQQASVATAVLRRERAAFTGAVNERGRAASTSPIKRNALAATQEARTQALFRYFSMILLICN